MSNPDGRDSGCDRDGGVGLKSPAFRYVKPASLAETFGVLKSFGDEARLLAGGQSLLAALNMRLASPRVLVDINDLADLAGIRVSENAVTIGALTRHRTVERSPDIRRYLPLLYQAMPYVAHPAVRNRGTFGGSISFADPAAELPACCVALGAVFQLASETGVRSVPAREFFKGMYETALRPDEALVAADIPVIGRNYRSAFAELSLRHGDYAIVGLAGHAKYEDGALSDVRLVYFGVGSAPVFAEAASRILEGKTPSPGTVLAAQRELPRDLAPNDDAMYSAAVRMHWAGELLVKVVEQFSAKDEGNRE